MKVDISTDFLDFFQKILRMNELDLIGRTFHLLGELYIRVPVFEVWNNYPCHFNHQWPQKKIHIPGKVTAVIGTFIHVHESLSHLSASYQWKQLIASRMTVSIITLSMKLIPKPFVVSSRYFIYVQKVDSEKKML